MPAAVIKGILISLSIIAALGVAVLENPQVQVWLEEQRRKLAELLRSIGEELDPESRRAAEAFAYEGRTPATDPGLRREASASLEAAAVATGRSLNNAGPSVRRIPISGPKDPNMAEERKRKGNEYLARRNQEMIELHKRLSVTTGRASASSDKPMSHSATTLDALVDGDGRLRAPDSSLQGASIPSPPTAVEKLAEAMASSSGEGTLRLGSGHDRSCHAFDMRSRLADPFSDDFALDRSEDLGAPPALPPKIALDDVVPDPPVSVPDGSRAIPNAQHPTTAINTEGLSYEEQLAIALSLSEAENVAVGERRADDHDDEDLRNAIAASLQEPSKRDDSLPPVSAQDSVPALIDFEEQESSAWPRFFHPTAPSEATTEELYRITPRLTHARLASLNTQHLAESSPVSPLPVMQSVEQHATTSLQDTASETAEPTFHLAPSTTLSAPAGSDRSITRGEAAASDQPHRTVNSATRTPPPAYETDSDSDTFASMSESASQVPSVPSDVEVIEVVEESDVDMLSEEGDGVATPDTWTEVGSSEGESDVA